MRVFILDFFVKTVGYLDKNDKTICSYPIFLIINVFLMRKNIVCVKLQPRMQAFGHVEMVNGDQCQS